MAMTEESERLKHEQEKITVRTRSVFPATCMDVSIPNYFM